MKYIDAEKLLDIIIKMQKEYATQEVTEDHKGLRAVLGGQCFVLTEIIDVITSLQQEQLEVDLEKEIDVFFYGKNFKRCFDGVRVPGALMRDWQNQNVSMSLSTDEIRRFARHFYEL